MKTSKLKEKLVTLLYGTIGISMLLGFLFWLCLDLGAPVVFGTIGFFTIVYLYGFSSHVMNEAKILERDNELLKKQLKAK
jgi:hypothetical protein